MKFAIFEFCEDNSCAVGESKWIINQDEESFNNEDWVTSREVLIRWPKAMKEYTKWSNKNGKTPMDPEIETKTHVAKVIKFNDKYDSIREFMTTYLNTGSTVTPTRGRGKRATKQNSRYLVDSTSDEAPSQVSKKLKTKKTPANSALSDMHIQHLKRKISEESQYSSSECSSEEEMADSSEVSKLKALLREKNNEILELKATINRGKDLQDLRSITMELKKSAQVLSFVSRHFKKNEDSVGLMPNMREELPSPGDKQKHGRLPSSPAGSQQSLPSTSSDAEDDNVMVCPGVWVSKAHKKVLCSKQSTKEFIYSIMPMIWSREVLSSHSVTGRISNAHKTMEPKPQLDQKKVQNICDFASKKYGCTISEVRQHMTTKINSIVKCYKLQKAKLSK